MMASVAEDTDDKSEGGREWKVVWRASFGRFGYMYATVRYGMHSFLRSVPLSVISVPPSCSQGQGQGR